MNNKASHTFHIPVMGTGFTVDTPLKVAQFGISSVISIVDDVLLEKMREFHSHKFDLPFSPISNRGKDFRAERITAYLNMVDDIVKVKFDDLKNSFQKKSKEMEKYMDLLPDFSSIKKEFNEHVKGCTSLNEFKNWVQDHLPVGSIDVNIMTKVDKANYHEGEALPSEYNDAHAALRGFALSNLKSSLVLSAGMNPRLYGYIEQFENFFPDANGYVEKKIALKVSDFRSALVQGQYLAKKGIWISEYRIESGLNCGGHAFATDGSLMGPILEEFKTKRNDLIDTLHPILVQGLKDKGRICPSSPMEIKVTAQGGVGTSEEHQFLMDYYQLDSVGWGSPFLLVPEACDVDDKTRKLLEQATENDLYLSHSSPLGVRFNNLKGNTRDEGKMEQVMKGEPGSVCTKRYMVANTEFTEKPICTASRQYQKLKMAHLKTLNLTDQEYQKALEKMSERTCLCKGLGTASLLCNGLDTAPNGDGVSICPGPNLAYFNRTSTLKEMVDHIYGRINLIKCNNRPHMFVKELQLYMNYLKEQLDENPDLSKKLSRQLEKFRKNLMGGISYYKDLSSQYKEKFQEVKAEFILQLDSMEKELQSISIVATQPTH